MNEFSPESGILIVGLRLLYKSYWFNGIIVFKPSLPPPRYIKTNFLLLISQLTNFLAIFNALVIWNGNKPIADAEVANFIKFLLFTSIDFRVHLA